MEMMRQPPSPKFDRSHFQDIFSDFDLMVDITTKVISRPS